MSIVLSVLGKALHKKGKVRLHSKLPVKNLAKGRLWNRKQLLYFFDSYVIFFIFYLIFDNTNAALGVYSVSRETSETYKKQTQNYKKWFIYHLPIYCSHI